MGNSSEAVDESVPVVVPDTPNISNEFEKMLLKFPRTLFEEAVARYEEKKASPPSKKRKKKKKFFHRVKRHRKSVEPSTPSSSDPSDPSASSAPSAPSAPSDSSSSHPLSSSSSSSSSLSSSSEPLPPSLPTGEPTPTDKSTTTAVTTTIVKNKPGRPPKKKFFELLSAVAMENNSNNNVHDENRPRESKKKFYDLLSSVVHGNPCPTRFEDDYNRRNVLPISTSKTKLSKAEKQAIAKLLKCRRHFPAEIITIEGKGTGVKTLRPLVSHQFICEYAGELITKTEALRREKEYAATSTTRIMSCYMYYFEHRGQELCIDATRDGAWGIGRLINHSVDGNVDTVKLTVNGMPRLVFVANRDIKAGDELAYDYGDRTSFAAFPWLKK